ncbi:MAG: hypothetical protein AAF916_06690 [Planctomycetota bacterium]
MAVIGRGIALLRRARKSPGSILLALIVGVVLAIWLVPPAYDRYRIAGLQASDPDHRAAALAYVAEHANRHSRVQRLTVAKLADLQPETAARTYLALRQRDESIGYFGYEAQAQLMAAYATADAPTLVEMIDRVSPHAGVCSPVSQALIERLESSEDDRTFRELVDRLQRFRAWRPAEIPLPAWRRWLEPQLASDVASIRAKALMRLSSAVPIMAAQATLDVPPHQRIQSTGTDFRLASDVPQDEVEAIARLVTRGREDADPQVRRAADFVFVAWSHLFDQDHDHRHSQSDHDFLAVVPANAQTPDPASEEDLYRLFQIESARVQQTTPQELGVDASDQLPPLLRAMLVRAIAEPDRGWLLPALEHDRSHLRAVAAVLADRHLAAGDRNHLFSQLVNDVDPVVRQSGILLQSLDAFGTHDPKQFAASAATPRTFRQPWYKDPAQLDRITDFTTRVLLNRVGPHRRLDQTDDEDAALLEDGRIDTPIVLTAMLADRRKAAWDALLGPLSLSDDDLATLLDHHRFAWVLDAFLPAEVPRFPLWVDRDTQRQAIADLRHWYARHRATWTAH